MKRLLSILGFLAAVLTATTISASNAEAQCAACVENYSVFPPTSTCQTGPLAHPEGVQCGNWDPYQCYVIPGPDGSPCNGSPSALTPVGTVAAVGRWVDEGDDDRPAWRACRDWLVAYVYDAREEIATRLETDHLVI